jgi:DNA mismatch endonuclease, patch repair protein
MAKKVASPRTPEAVLRSLLHAQGLRFALRPRPLPGQPELVLPRRHSVLLLRGCFWHGHDCPDGRAAPKFKVGAWAEKIAANRAHDQAQLAALQAAGWRRWTSWRQATSRR